MAKIIFLSISTFILVMVSMAQASSILDEQKQVSRLSQCVMEDPRIKTFSTPAELPFIEHCKLTGIEWSDIKERLLEEAEQQFQIFRNTACKILKVNRARLVMLGIEELHRQYAELYELLSTPTPQPKPVMAVMAEQTPRPRLDSEDSALDPSDSSLSSSFTGSEDSDSSVSAGPQLADADAGSDGPPLGSSASESGFAEFDDLFTSDGSQPESRPLLGGLRQRLNRPLSSKRGSSSELSEEALPAGPPSKRVKDKQEESNISPSGWSFDMTDFFSSSLTS